MIDNQGYYLNKRIEDLEEKVFQQNIIIKSQIATIKALQNISHYFMEKEKSEKEIDEDFQSLIESEPKE